MTKPIHKTKPGARRELTRGERAADAVRDFLGSWRFIIAQTIFITVWIIGNGYLLLFEFDKYPFILLNLAFSTQAAYASPIILMSQRRTDQISTEIALYTFDNTKAIAEIIERNTDLTKSIGELVEDNTEITKAIAEIGDAVRSNSKPTTYNPNALVSSSKKKTTTTAKPKITRSKGK